MTSAKVSMLKATTENCLQFAARVKANIPVIKADLISQI